jgi:hypothetical protein
MMGVSKKNICQKLYSLSDRACGELQNEVLNVKIPPKVVEKLRFG